MTATGATAHFDMGRVISRTFGAVGKNLPTFALLTLLLYAAPQFVVQWGIGYLNSGVGTMAALSGGSLVFVGGIISFVLAYVLQACLVHGTVAYLGGKPADLGKGLSTGFSVFLPLIVVSILVTLGEVLGFFLLIVPGFMLMVRWSVAIPSLVVERERGIFGSMGRSADLTKGHRWSIFGLFVIVAIIMWIVSAVAMGIGLGIGGAALFASPEAMGAALRSPIVIGVQTVFNSFVVMLGAAGVASLYYELRSLKEGVGAHDLAAVFD